MSESENNNDLATIVLENQKADKIFSLALKLPRGEISNKDFLQGIKTILFQKTKGEQETKAMIPHCAFCKHSYNAGTSTHCSYIEEPVDYYDRPHEVPCRKLTKAGGFYHCFENRDDAEPWSAIEHALEMLDRLEYRLERIEAALRKV